MLQMINLTSPSKIFPLCEQRKSYFTVAAERAGAHTSLGERRAKVLSDTHTESGDKIPLSPVW